MDPKLILVSWGKSIITTIMIWLLERINEDIFAKDPSPIIISDSFGRSKNNNTQRYERLDKERLRVE